MTAPPTTTTTTTPTTPTTSPTPPTPPVQPRIAGISATTIVWSQGDGCRYPATGVRFELNRATTARLLLRIRVYGHWTTTIHHPSQRR